MNGPLIDASGRVRDLEAERRHRQARTLRGIAIGFVVFVVINMTLVAAESEPAHCFELESHLCTINLGDKG